MIVDLLIALIWYLVLTLFGVMVLPLSMRIFRRMPERGILLSRPLGWLLLGCITWQVCHWTRLPFYAVTVALVAAGLTALSVWTLRSNPRWFLRGLRQRWRTALNGEIITVVVFLLLLYIRGFDPNVDHTEKPMDLMMISALTYAQSLPPQDLWFAGEAINYHYGGYLLHAIPAKLLSMLPEYTYNLAIPTTGAMAASVAFVLGRALFGRCRWGALTVVTTLFVGNVASALLAFSRETLPPTLFAWRWEYLFRLSRVIEDPDGQTINEFPFFTLMWSDVHPHFTNIPFFLLFMAMVYALLLAVTRLPMRRWWSVEWPLLLAMLASASMLLPTNIFDFPVLSFFFGAILVLGVLARGSMQWSRRSWPGLAIGVGVLLLPIFAYLGASVFWLHFTNPLQGAPIALAPHGTSVIPFVLVFGFHLVAMLTYVGIRASRATLRVGWEEMAFVGSFFAIALVVLWAVSVSLVSIGTSLLAMALWCLALLSIWPKNNPFRVEAPWRNRELYGLVACALAWSLIAACEFIYLPDSYGIRRMNTLFKFHFPAWLLMGVALPPLLFFAIRRIPQPRVRLMLALPMAGLLLASLVGPQYVLRSFFNMEKNVPYTLNGLSFASGQIPGAMTLIHWLRENADYNARLLEVPGGAYQPIENLVSAASGRASVIGWQNHENVWRGRFHPVGQRGQDATEFFTTQDWDRAQAILDEYEVDYVVFTPPSPSNQGMMRLYPEMTQAAFRTRLERVASYEGPRPFELYRVRHSEEAGS